MCQIQESGWIKFNDFSTVWSRTSNESNHAFISMLRVLPTVEILNIRQKYEIKAGLRGCSFLSVPGRVKRTSDPGLSTRELCFWCPDDQWCHVGLRGRWLHNQKNWKKWWNLWSYLLKRDGNWKFSKALKWILRMPTVLFLNIFAWHHPYKNLEGFKVENWRKNGIFLKSFWS